MVAEVPVAVENRKSVRVEEAVEMKPFRNARVVDVACSLERSLVKGQEKELAVGHEVRQSPDRQKLVVDRFVVVAFVVVLFEALKF